MREETADVYLIPAVTFYGSLSFFAAVAVTVEWVQADADVWITAAC